MPKGIVHCNCKERIAGISGLVTIHTRMSDAQIKSALEAERDARQDAFDNAYTGVPYFAPAAAARMSFQPALERANYDLEMFILTQAVESAIGASMVAEAEGARDASGTHWLQIAEYWAASVDALGIPSDEMDQFWGDLLP